MNKWIAILALVGLSLAGCANGGGGGSGDDDEAATGDVVDVPEWAVGDAWRFTASSGATPTYAVAADDGGTWRMLPDNGDTAAFEATNDISLLGNIRKSDLAGDQGGPVQFFDWPLVHDNSWTTTWDGVSLTITSHLMSDGTWHMQGMDGERLDVEYIYDPEARWFRSLTWYDENGTEEFSMTLEEASRGWTGTLYEAQVEQIFSHSQGEGTRTQPFTVADSVSALWLNGMVECGGPVGDARAGIWGPTEQPVAELDILVDNPEWGIVLTCPSEGHAFVSTPSIPGTWTFRDLVAAETGLVEVQVDAITYTLTSL